MTVKLVEGDYSGGGFTPVNTTLQSVKTDAQGNYQFSYKRQYNRTYDAIAVNSSPDYNEYTQAVLIPDGSANVINIFLLPFGWLKLHVKNVNPYDNRDEVKFFYGSCYGSKVDSIIYVKVGGSPKTARDIRIWTTKNSVQTYKDASVITPPRDTTLLNIFY
jgi:hypothetical protein